MKKCRNCQSRFDGMFCPSCGQKDVELERPIGVDGQLHGSDRPLSVTGPVVELLNELPDRDPLHEHSRAR